MKTCANCNTLSPISGHSISARLCIPYLVAVSRTLSKGTVPRGSRLRLDMCPCPCPKLSRMCVVAQLLIGIACPKSSPRAERKMSAHWATQLKTARVKLNSELITSRVRRTETRASRAVFLICCAQKTNTRQKTTTENPKTTFHSHQLMSESKG